MSEDQVLNIEDTAPGDEALADSGVVSGIRGYLVGLGLALLLTAISFWIAGTSLIWGPAIPVALIVFAIGQMGVHLVYFLHITTAPDNTNNILALGFGVLIVFLIIGGSIWIMDHLNANMGEMPPMQMSSPK